MNLIFNLDIAYRSITKPYMRIPGCKGSMKRFGCRYKTNRKRQPNRVHPIEGNRGEAYQMTKWRLSWKSFRDFCRDWNHAMRVWSIFRNTKRKAKTNQCNYFIRWACKLTLIADKGINLIKSISLISLLNFSTLNMSKCFTTTKKTHII